MAAADSKILHDIFTYPGLRNIRVYYYSEQDKENYKKLFSEQEFPGIERITEYVCSRNAQVRNVDDMDGMQIQIRQEEVIARNIKGYITTIESLKRVINSNLIDDLKAGYLEE